jgi:hypothetical protein
MAHLNAKVLRLVALSQDTVVVNPPVFDVVGIVANKKEVGGMYDLPIADVGEEIRLPNRDAFFSFYHNR